MDNETQKALFDYSFQKALGLEGGFSDHPRDPGGATKYGISLRYLRTQNAINGDLDGDGDIDIDDILAMSETIARNLYYKDWWLVGPYIHLPVSHQEVIIKLFDLSINMGQTSANKLLQRALRGVTEKILIEDGIVGNRTINEIYKTAPDMLLCALKMAADGHYRYLTARNEDLKVFLAGWLNRAHA